MQSATPVQTVINPVLFWFKIDGKYYHRDTVILMQGFLCESRMGKGKVGELEKFTGSRVIIVQRALWYPTWGILTEWLSFIE